MDPLVAHQRAQDAFAEVLANVGTDQLAAPTPCAEWTVSDLIEHVIGGNENVAKLAGLHHDPVARSDDLVAAHRATAVVAQQVFAGPGAMAAAF